VGVDSEVNLGIRGREFLLKDVVIRTERTRGSLGWGRGQHESQGLGEEKMWV